jgi:hypothetical protein
MLLTSLRCSSKPERRRRPFLRIFFDRNLAFHDASPHTVHEYTVPYIRWWLKWAYMVQCIIGGGALQRNVRISDAAKTLMPKQSASEKNTYPKLVGVSPHSPPYCTFPLGQLYGGGGLAGVWRWTMLGKSRTCKWVSRSHCTTRKVA